MAAPLLRMGFIGFADERHLGDLLKTRSHSLRWQPWSYLDADALWVNGAHAQVARNQLVRVPSADPQKPAVLLNLPEVDRPVAFTLPMGNESFDPPFAFDPRSAPSVAQVLVAFETLLRPLATQLAFAAEVVARRRTLASSVYHLIRDGTLVAILDAHGDVGIMPDLSPAELQDAHWSGRPEAAAAMPPHFQRIGFAELMWQYVLRSDEDLLPRKYRKRTIYFRKVPAIDRRLLKDSHLAVLSALSASPLSFEHLQAHIGFSAAQLTQALTALYFAGSITTEERFADPERLELARMHAADAGHAFDPSGSSSPDPSAGIPPMPGTPLRPHAVADTVPTPLSRN